MDGRELIPLLESTQELSYQAPYISELAARLRVLQHVGTPGRPSFPLDQSDDTKVLRFAGGQTHAFGAELTRFSGGASWNGCRGEREQPGDMSPGCTFKR
jgi:hypothetical protein